MGGVGTGIPRYGFRMTKGWRRRVEQAGWDVDGVIKLLETEPVRTIEALKRQGLVPESAQAPLAIASAPRPRALTWQGSMALADQPVMDDSPDETDEEISKRIKERFETITLLATAAVKGEIRALIISGPGGLSKSFTVDKAIHDAGLSDEQFRYVKGYLRPTGLYKMLYESRFGGQLLVLDDADSFLLDETSLNFIKAATDTTNIRTVHYLSEKVLHTEDGETLPSRFQFDGTVIVLTNKSLPDMMSRGGKLAPHYDAIMTRSHYIDCGLKSARDYIIRIKQVCAEGMLWKNHGITEQQSAEVIDFIEDNKEKLSDISLRVAIKIAALIRSNPIDWRRLAMITCCKQR